MNELNQPRLALSDDVFRWRFLLDQGDFLEEFVLNSLYSTFQISFVSSPFPTPFVRLCDVCEVFGHSQVGNAILTQVSLRRSTASFARNTSGSLGSPLNATFHRVPPTGFQFESHFMQTAGELVKAGQQSVGTDIELCLRPRQQQIGFQVKHVKRGAFTFASAVEEIRKAMFVARECPQLQYSLFIVATWVSPRLDSLIHEESQFHGGLCAVFREENRTAFRQSRRVPFLDPSTWPSSRFEVVFLTQEGLCRLFGRGNVERICLEVRKGFKLPREESHEFLPQLFESGGRVDWDDADVDVDEVTRLKRQLAEARALAACEARRRRRAESALAALHVQLRRKRKRKRERERRGAGRTAMEWDEDEPPAKRRRLE